MREGLLEQQVSLGWGIIALVFIALGRYVWLIRSRDSACGVRVPILVAVAFTALACSLPTLPLASCHGAVPMFRSYARFGVLVQLMAVLLAGIGVDFLRRSGTTRARIASAALVALVAVEYAVGTASAVARCAPDECASMGHATARVATDIRLHSAR